MRIVAVIPVKSRSERVPSKNFREFSNNKSLLELLLQKLIATDRIDAIYVSTNEDSIRQSIIDKGCVYVPRADEYCNNETSWSEVITHVVSSLPEDDEVTVMWCHTTSPLFARYSEAIDKFIEVSSMGSHNGLVTVSRMTDFIVTERGRPLNYSWGVWHPYSQNLDLLYSITGALFIAKKQEMVRNRYVVSREPFLFETSAYESIDVDTQFDFELSRIMYENRDRLDKF
jgi:CMP-N-acetylneuraminic acid synthetase